MPRERLDFYAPQDWPVSGPIKEEPWLQWPDEPDADYTHFQCYRDLPPPRRTVENAFLVYAGEAFAGESRPERTHVPKSWISQAKKWRWRERCIGFDRWKEKSQLEAERDGTLEAWREMGERHAREALALQQKALERLRSMNPSELSASEVRQFLVQAATLERLARGASLQDMARVQREKELEAAQDGVAVITYVDDWRGDEHRRQKRNPDSFYGNGQGVLPSVAPQTPPPPERNQRGKSAGLPLVRSDGSPVEGSRSEIPLSRSPSGADGGDEAPPKVHLPRRRKKVAKDHHGDDAGRGGGDQG